MKKINLTEYIQKSGETLRLTDSERARMKHVLSEYMSVKPIRSDLSARRTPIKTAWIELYVFSRKSVAGILTLALLFSGAGISYAAESAVPGDALYPLKVGVNEPIGGALSVSAEAKASWNANLAERRLEEAEKLASDDKLTDERKAELVARFDEHADAATDDIEKLETSGSPSAVGIASHFETTLAAHETVLGDVDGKSGTDFVRSRVRAKALALSKIREKAEEDVMVSSAASEPIAVATLSAPAPVPAIAMGARVALKSDASERSRSDETAGVRKEVAGKMSVAAKDSLQNVKKIFARIGGRLDSDTQARVSGEISAQEALIQTGDTAFSSGDLAAAFRAYQEATVNSGKLAVYLKAFLKLKIKNLPSERPILQAVQNAEPLSSGGEAEHREQAPRLLPPIQILPEQGDGNQFSGPTPHEEQKNENDSGSGKDLNGDIREGNTGPLKINLGI